MRRVTLEKLMAAHCDGQALVRALNVESGEELLVDPAADHSPLGIAAGEAVRADASGPVSLEGQRWFLTVYNVPWEIAIVGAVHIAQALTTLATAAGYRVRIIDPRAAYATQERFPGTTLQHAWPDEALAERPLTSRSALVVLAHDPKLDDAGLAMALRSPAPYIGALGSRRTQARRKARLREQGFSAAELNKIRGPVGLAIGARTPAEIAIAILAELVQHRRAPKSARIAGIVLAAGASSRMGHNKLIAVLDTKPMVRHVVDAARTALLDPIIVVTGHDAPAVRAALADAGVGFVQNDAFADGLSTSLRAGIGAVPEDCSGAVVLLGDMPGVDPHLIDQLRAAFQPAQGRAICVATAHGERGHPVLWARQFFAEIAELKGDTGARSLMSIHADQVREVEGGNDSPLADIDTPQDLATFSN
jgi:CTP:molybdopterin cytidylyltransferase MocA/xanthine/CO dehydrogenase XdhC/CoxF family maturation factor